MEDETQQDKASADRTAADDARAAVMKYRQERAQAEAKYQRQKEQEALAAQAGLKQAEPAGEGQKYDPNEHLPDQDPQAYRATIANTVAHMKGWQIRVAYEVLKDAVEGKNAGVSPVPPASELERREATRQAVAHNEVHGVGVPAAILPHPEDPMTNVEKIDGRWRVYTGTVNGHPQYRWLGPDEVQRLELEPQEGADPTPVEPESGPEPTPPTEQDLGNPGIVRPPSPVNEQGMGSGLTPGKNAV